MARRVSETKNLIGYEDSQDNWLTVYTTFESRKRDEIRFAASNTAIALTRAQVGKIIDKIISWGMDTGRRK